MRILLLASATLTALLLPPVPALAADAATLGCIADRLDPSISRRLSDDLFQSIDADTARPPGDEPVEAVAAQAAACKQKHGWSDVAFEAAIGHVIAALTVPGAERALAGDGLDPAVVTRIFRALPDDMRASFQQDPIPDATIAAYMEAVIAAGLKVETDAHGEHLGILAALLAVAEVDRAKFVAN